MSANVDADGWVRCRRCDRVVARRLAEFDGAYEICRRGRPLAVVRDGEIACTGCGTVVVVRTKDGDLEPARQVIRSRYGG